MPTLSFFVVVANVRSHWQCRSFPITPNSLLHLLFVHWRMAILTGGIWFLLVSLIGIPPVMIRVAEHTSCPRRRYGVCWVFLPFKGVRKIDLWQLASWKLFCVWDLILQYPPQDISWGQRSRAAAQPLWIRGASKPWWSVVVTGNVHKAAALFDAHLWFLGQAEASGKSASPPVKQSGMCLSNHWRVCVSLLFPLKASHTYPSW